MNFQLLSIFNILLDSTPVLVTFCKLSSKLNTEPIKYVMLVTSNFHIDGLIIQDKLRYTVNLLLGKALNKNRKEFLNRKCYS